MTHSNLIWKKYPVLNDGFICLVDVMGDDSAIVQAARVSYGKDVCPECNLTTKFINNSKYCENSYHIEQPKKDRSLIRRLMKDGHTSPFEMVEFKFKVRVPMDCWRQWIRHRTANVNEYSTRYSEAIDSQQTTDPTQWRMQSINNKQGSSGFLPKDNNTLTDGASFTQLEYQFHKQAKQTYKARIEAGVAREQARKDLPLSTYTEAYWKCDLHNIFNFLRLRLDPHAQLEIRLYATAMYEIVKQVCPIACEAFENYVLNTVKFSEMEMGFIYNLCKEHNATFIRPDNMTDNEWKSFLEKLK